jgi:glycosyltransferase 2 family protein
VKKHAAEWTKGLIKYGIGFGLLAIVIARYWNDNPETGAVGLKTLLQGPIAFHWLLAAAGLVATALTLQLLRWYILVRALDLPFTLRNAFRLGMVGVFYNTFLPGSVGGDLLKAYFIAKAHPERKTRAVATVLIDRAMGLFGLILFVAGMGALAWSGGDPRITANPELMWLIKVMAAIAGGTILGFLLLGLLPQRRVDRFARRLMWFPKIGGSLAEFWYAVWIYRQRPRVVVLGVGLSALSHFALVFAFHSASRVFPPESEGQQATLAEHMVIAPIGFIVQAIPVSPGGVGVGEAAFAGLYKLSGRPPSRGVIARLSMRVVEWLIGLIGYLIYLRMKKELPVVEEAEEEQREPQSENQRDA